MNYEWNFGASFGWKPYDEYDNPENQIIGPKVNAYLNVNLYLKWALAPKVDLRIGATGSHFSNGNKMCIRDRVPRATSAGATTT